MKKKISSAFVFLAALFAVFAVSAFSVAALFASTAVNRGLVIDGDLSEWADDELVYDDSRNDSPWGEQNEIHRLYATWDSAALYIGVSGVQKDGNNLIVYIDTSPLDGISDASLLKDPGDSSQMWWWRRGNRFSAGFRPDFQWHMYEMRLNTYDGHGFFRMKSDYTTANLNSSVEQKSSGGGAGLPGSAEIKIPWSILYGAAGFPAGEELRILAVVTGGMDTRGTADPSDDLYGSARDAAPDQSDSFPEVWHDSFILDKNLALKISGPAGRSSVPRSFSVVQTSATAAKAVWRARGVVEKNLDEYRVYYSSGSGEVFVSVMPGSTQTAVTGLSRGATYQFYLRAVYGGAPGGASETVPIFMSRPDIDHLPSAVFGFPGKNMKLGIVSSRVVSSAVIKYAVGSSDSWRSAPMSVTQSGAEVALGTPSSPASIKYYFEAICGQDVYRLPSGAPEEVYVTSVVAAPSAYVQPSSASSTVDFGSGVRLDLPAFALSAPVTIYFHYSDNAAELPSSDVNLKPVGYYDFYVLDEKGERAGVVFDKTASLSLKYFEEDLGGAAESSLVVARVAGTKTYNIGGAVSADDNIISVGADHLSRFGIFSASGSGEIPGRVLRKVVRPVFNPSLGETVEFDCAPSAKIEIFDLNGRKIKATEKNFWDGRDSSGSKADPGIYLYRLEIGTDKIYGSCVVVR